MKLKVFIIDDNKEVARLIQRILKREKYSTEIFERGIPALDEIKYRNPDLVLLDLILPDIDGIEICRLLKNNPATKNIPLIMITARDTSAAKVQGLRLGADDYITKPFVPEELLARIEALIRRLEYGGDTEKTVHAGSIRLNTVKRTVKIGSREITDLTCKEFDVFELLVKRAGHVVPKDTFLDLIWGDYENVYYKTLEVHMCRLKKKIAGADAERIQCVRGVGYKLLKD